MAGVFRQHRKGHDFPRRAGRVASRTLDSGVSRGLTNVLGVLADDKTNMLWVCQNKTGGRGGTPVAGQTPFSFDSRAVLHGHVSLSEQWRGGTTWPWPGCTVYATESFAIGFTASSLVQRNWTSGCPPIATGRRRWHCDAGRWSGG